MSTPDFKRRNVKKNKARLWEQNEVTAQMMTRHLTASFGGVATPEPRAQNVGSRFYIHMDNFKGVDHTDDANIRGAFRALRHGWVSDLIDIVREEVDLVAECPWCGGSNGFNTTMLGIIAASGYPIPEDVFICDKCLKLVGKHNLWDRSMHRAQSNYPNQIMGTLVGMFAYPIRDKDGCFHGMPWHKGLYKNASWRQSEHWSKSVGRATRKSIMNYINGESTFDSEADMNRYLYIPLDKGFIVRPLRGVDIGEHLRMLGVMWGRKHVYLGFCNGEARTRRGHVHEIYYSLLARPTAKHKKYIVVRRTTGPPTFEWMDKLE